MNINVYDLNRKIVLPRGLVIDVFSIKTVVVDSFGSALTATGHIRIGWYPEPGWDNTRGTVFKWWACKTLGSKNGWKIQQTKRETNFGSGTFDKLIHSFISRRLNAYVKKTGRPFSPKQESVAKSSGE